MKNCACLLLMIVVAQITQAAGFPRSSGFWCSGTVVLEDQRVIEGEINYDLKFGAIQVKRNGLVKTYTAENIAHFTLFDAVKHRERQFVAIDHTEDEGYHRKTFFEVISEGKLTILRKSKYVRKPRVTEDARAPHIYMNAVCRHQYYVFRDNRFSEIDDFKEEILPLMRDQQQEVSAYIRQCKLKLKRIHEQMRVVALYNQLCQSDANKGALTEQYP